MWIASWQAGELVPIFVLAILLVVVIGVTIAVVIAAARRNSAQSQQPRSGGDARGLFALLGAALGGSVGFLLRPANGLTGQVDFATAITRGTNLRGLDTILTAQAETSFNMMLFGALIGAGVGFAVVAVRKT